MRKQIFATDVIGEDFERWRAGEYIILRLPTGSGKSTMAKKYVLYAIRRKMRVLILVPRVILLQQYEADMQQMIQENFGDLIAIARLVSIKTYQQVEQRMKEIDWTEKYDLIIADEFHYLLDDAEFNPNTIYSLEFLKEQKKAIKVLISATGEDILEFLQEEKIFRVQRIFNKECQDILETEEEMNIYISGPGCAYEYLVDAEYTDMQIEYIKSADDIVTVMTEQPKEKTMIFVQSKAIGEKVKKKLENGKWKVDYITAENKEENAECIAYIAENRTFPSDVLIATSVLDVGVSLEDSNIKKVFLCALEKNTFLQMLGRVRRVEGRYCCKFYFCSMKASELKNIIKKEKYNEKKQFLSTFISENVSEEGVVDTNWLDWDTEYLKMLKYLCYRIHGRYMLNRLYVYKLFKKCKNAKEILSLLEENEDGLLQLYMRWIGREDDFSEHDFAMEAVLTERMEDLLQFLKDKVKQNEKYSSEKIRGILNADIKAKMLLIDSKMLKSRNENLSVKKFNEFFKLRRMNIQICQEKGSDKLQKYWFEGEVEIKGGKKDEE